MLSSPPSIAIRADASTEMGTGHIMRCLTLADELKRRGAEVTFICRDILPMLHQRIGQAGHALKMLPPAAADEPPNDGPPHAHWLKAHWRTDAEHTQAILREPGGVDWLVVDHYALDARWERLMRPLARRIMVIDDLADRAHDCNLLLDHLLDRKSEDYHELVPSNTTILHGGHFFLLRPIFSAIRPSALERRIKTRHIKRILVSFGGIQGKKLILSSLIAIQDVFECNVYVDLAIGNMHIEPNSKLEVMLRNVAFPVKIHDYSTDIAQLMHDADLAIGAAGMSSLERFCLGLPTISVSLANNQDHASKVYEQIGAVRRAFPNRKSFGKLLGEMAGNPELLKRMSQTAANLTDGKGTIRVANIMARHTLGSAHEA